MTTVVATKDFLAADKRMTYRHTGISEAMVADKIITLIPNKLYCVIAGCFSDPEFQRVKKDLFHRVLPNIKSSESVLIKDLFDPLKKYPFFDRARAIFYAKEFVVQVVGNGAILSSNISDFVDCPQGSSSDTNHFVMGSGANIAIVGLKKQLPVEEIFRICGTLDRASSKEFDIVYNKDMESFFEETTTEEPTPSPSQLKREIPRY